MTFTVRNAPTVRHLREAGGAAIRRLLLFGFGAALAAPVLAQSEEFRAMWVNAWNSGILNAPQVTMLVNDIRAANMNAVIPQIRRRGDSLYASQYEPYASGLSPANFNALADLISKAHNTNTGPYLEVHAWIVTYHIWRGATNTTTPGATHPLKQHPDWLLQDVNGNVFIDNQYTFDPGHPEVQRHTFNVCMDIATNYNVDGLNFDYIRYSGTDEGYNPVTVARFNQRFARTGQPSPSDALWKQFRRDQITGLLRKVYLSVMAVRPQVKISCDTITWAPGPADLSAWYNTSAAWTSVLQDWRGWMEEGIMDLNIPMTYFRQTTHPADYVTWMNFAKDHRYNRHAVIGPGTYLNSQTDAIIQMRKVREPSLAGNYADGICGYDYNTPYSGGVGFFSNFGFSLTSSPNPYDPVSPALFASPTMPKPMPWKTAPTKGHLMGTVYTGIFTNGLDGAVVTLTGPVTRAQTNDATGFYGFVDLPPGTYTVMASYPGYASASTNVTLTVSNVAVRNLQLLLQGPPAIAAQPQSQTVYSGAVASFSVAASGPPILAYQWRQEGANLSGATSSALMFNPATTNDAGDYDVVVTNTFGKVTSDVATLTVLVPPTNMRSRTLWDLAVAERPYLTAGNTERGLAFNPVSRRLHLVGRAGSPQIYVLNPDTGDDLHTLDLGAGVISGGTYTLQLIGAADDGAVYVCNLSLNGSTTAFRLYRWASDDPATPPTVAFSGDPHPGNPQRWGDTMDVRGAGAGTQIIIASRSGTTAVVFTTTDGELFTPQPVNVSGVSGGAFGLGLAFGAGDTFWGKATGQALRRVAFDLGGGTGSVEQTFDAPAVAGTISAIGVSTHLNAVVGVAVETPDNAKLFDLLPNDTLVLVGTNAFPTDNPNSNLTGAVDFDGDRVFVLDSNNGILALRLLPLAPPVFSAVALLAGGDVRLNWSGAQGYIFELMTSEDLQNWSSLGFFSSPTGEFEHVDAAAGTAPQRFYRLQY